MPGGGQTQIQFEALSFEGGLLPPEWLARVAALEAPHQSAADYHVPKGLHLRDEIARYWRIAEALWTELTSARAQAGHNALGATRHFVEQLLSQVFAFTDLENGSEREAGTRRFPISFEALGGRVPVIVGPHTEALDQSVARHGDGVRRRSAWGTLQEYLNAADGVLWGLAANGLVLRLGRDNASLTRPAWLEVDLERLFLEKRFADFSVLWLLIHASRFGRPDQPVSECPLEAWRAAAREEGSRARDQLRIGVERALLDLGQGFLSHPANAALREDLASGALIPQDYFNELLRLIYRAIFLLTVEERGILHVLPPADPDGRRVHDDAVSLYASGYGLRRLRERALRHGAHDRHVDLWESLRPVFAGLGRATGEAALALPGLGGLFAADQCPHLDSAVLDNRSLLDAVFHLAWLREGGALARVNWKDMGAEEFGSVYESLLELVPRIDNGGRRFTFAEAADSTGNERKQTGSYYTPDALVQQLLDTALEPVIAQRLVAAPHDAESALLSISVVDPACGSGHFLLAAARRLAGHLARLRAGGTPSADEYRHAMRDVVTRCIHGVDRNPMALELARMALWLEAYTPDRALGFLDHHMICGDALLGLLDLGALRDGIPDKAFKALTGDDKETAKVLAKRNREGRKALEDVLGVQHTIDWGTGALSTRFAALDTMADDALDGVEAKRAHWVALHAELQASPLSLAADCFLAGFLTPKTAQTRDAVTTSGSLLAAMDGTLPETHAVARLTRRVCREARVLHWPLTFPQVFARGGFDVVVGNPPWEVSQFGEEEFFAVRAPEVAALVGARRKAAIAALERENPYAWQQYVTAKFHSEAVNAAYRGNPRFTMTAVGKINTYALFAESAVRMLTASGRAGLVVPLGIATDDSTKDLFQHLIDDKRLVSLLGCYEVRRWFPGTDDRKSFCMLTIGSAPLAEFAFMLMDVSQFADRRKRFVLTPADIQLLNPNSRTCPIFRSVADAELTKKIYRKVPVLIHDDIPADEGNPWRISFLQGLFNLTSDSALFLQRPTGDSVPLYEAKLFSQFDHRSATYVSPVRSREEPTLRETSDEEREDFRFAVQPRYWVDKNEVEERLKRRHWGFDWLISWRDIALLSVERTVICSVLPRVGVGHTAPLLFCEGSDAKHHALLLGNLNSITLDYVARLKIGGTHLTYGYLKQFPVLRPNEYATTDVDFIVPRVLELTYTACDLTPWARDLGHDGPPFSWDPERRAVLRAELDAQYAYLYGLTRDELRYVLDPADVMGPDYPSETFRVLKQAEERQHGEYRTRRLVLEAWDRLFGA